MTHEQHLEGCPASVEHIRHRHPLQRVVGGGVSVLAGPGSEAAALMVSVALLGVALPLFEAAQFVAGVASGHFDPEVTTGVLLEDVFGFHGVAGAHSAPESVGCGVRILFDEVMEVG